MKNYFIYKYTFSNGKVYIGQTYHGSKRYGRVCEYKNSPLVYRAMKKYKTFDKEIIVDNLTLEEVDDFEIYYINLYESTNPKKGYNISSGGYTIKKGNVPWNKGIKTGIEPPNKGKSINNWMNEENIEKIKSNLIPGSKKGRKCSNNINTYVYNINTKEEIKFDSALNAALYIGMKNDKNLSRYKNKNKPYNGFLIYNRGVII